VDINAIVIIECTTRGIGKDGNLLKSFKEDLRRFKSLTTNNVVVMGSTTFIKDLKGVPLKNRINIVLTSKLDNKQVIDNVIYLNMLPLQVLEYIANNYSDKQVFIIGGESIYKQFLLYVNTLYVTEYVDDNLAPDTFFPVIQDNEWLLNNKEEINILTFKMYKRIK
jgi:dihydrofolate reductase